MTLLEPCAALFLEHVNAMRTMTIRELLDFHSTAALVEDAKRFLQAMHFECRRWHPEERKLETVYVRVFLMAYLLRLHQTDAFVYIIPEAVALIEASTALVEQTDELLLRIAARGGGSLCAETTRGLVERIGELQDRYFVWKTRDENRMIANVKSGLMHILDAMLRVAGEYHEIDYQDPLIVPLKEAMDRHIARLVRIAGIHEVYPFHLLVQQIVEDRRWLRMLREEQQRAPSMRGFDLIEPF